MTITAEERARKRLRVPASTESLRLAMELDAADARYAELERRVRALAKRWQRNGYMAFSLSHSAHELLALLEDGDEQG